MSKRTTTKRKPASKRKPVAAQVCSKDVLDDDVSKIVALAKKMGDPGRVLAVLGGASAMFAKVYAVENGVSTSMGKQLAMQTLDAVLVEVQRELDAVR